MPIIHLATEVSAPRERVFDLARSINAHLACAAGTGERAVAGTTTGLLGLGDEVGWQARHFGLNHRLRVKITRLDRPNSFQDSMLEGPFAEMTHDHQFEVRGSGTMMIDRFEFRSPYGPLGRVADFLVVERHLRRFLLGRNAALKRMAESEEWMLYLGSPGFHPPSGADASTPARGDA